MIVVALLIGVFGTFISFVYIKNIPMRAVFTTLSLIVLFGSTWAAVANDQNHLMMEEKTTTKTQRIYATKSTNGLNMMVYQNLGTQKKHNVQTYRKSASQKKPSHTQVDQYTTNKVVFTDDSQARLKTSTKRWKFTKAGDFWFGINNLKFKNDTSDSTIIKRTNTFYLPKSWIHLSANQAKQLGAQMKATQSGTAQAKQQAVIKQQAAAFVQAQLKAAMAKNPNLATDKSSQQAVVKQATADFQKQITTQKIKQVKQMVAQIKE